MPLPRPLLLQLPVLPTKYGSLNHFPETPKATIFKDCYFVSGRGIAIYAMLLNNKENANLCQCMKNNYVILTYFLG